MSERFFIPMPTVTDQTVHGGFRIYDASGIDLKWSGSMPLPKVGDRIYMTINSIGWGSVVGYAESHGFLGLLVKPENPPDWHKRQTAAAVRETKLAKKLGPEKAETERVRVRPQWVCDGIACVFGAEIKLEAAVPTK